MNLILFYLSNLHKGNNYIIYKNLKSIPKIDMNLLTQWVKEYVKKKIKFITILDEEYPLNLNIIKYPPYVLYMYGNTTLLKNKNKVYLVDERNMLDTFNSEKQLENMVNSHVLITNDYKESEKSIVDFYRNHNGSIIHILKEGFNDEILKQTLKPNELYISQYPLNCHPRREYFKQANLLSSLLSKQFISFSLKGDSKAIQLVNYFADIGKDIKCFPSDDFGDLNNQLIKSGATLITSVTEI
ncbi:DNA-processing protein DprA [Mycoplasma sp. 4079]|uniref:DNA-processing protein DprA n=1 Tax=Mycoplasma sp. 4079 TaxID=3398615 RepID=UPI0039FBA636